jgi:hypothetical protein
MRKVRRRRAGAGSLQRRGPAGPTVVEGRGPTTRLFAESDPDPETYTYVRRVVFLADAYRQIHADGMEGDTVKQLRSARRPAPSSSTSPRRWPRLS